MSLSSFVYDWAKAGWANGALCYWSSTTASFYVTLLSNNYTPNETHQYASAFSGAEIGATSFTSGYNGSIRISLTGRVLNINTTSHQAEFQANSVTWSGIGAANGTPYMFAVVQQAGSDGLSPLITLNSQGGFPITLNGTNLTISFTSAGVFDLEDF